MTSGRVRVEVRGQDGSVRTIERTLYSTRYGPVMSPVFGLPLNRTTSRVSVRDLRRAPRAFRLLGEARHIGTIVLTLPAGDRVHIGTGVHQDCPVPHASGLPGHGAPAARGE